jgi:hypothetical protein
MSMFGHLVILTLRYVTNGPGAFAPWHFATLDGPSKSSVTGQRGGWKEVGEFQADWGKFLVIPWPSLQTETSLFQP